MPKPTKDNRAYRFEAFVSLKGRTLPLAGGSVTGRIGLPSQCTVNVPYESVTAYAARDPLQVWCEIQEGKRKVKKMLFDGELSQIGRSKHERSRSLTLTGEGYSAIWFRTALYLINEFGASGLSYGDALRARSVGDPSGYTTSKRLGDLTNLYKKEDLSKFVRAVLARTGQSAGQGSQALARVGVLDDSEAVTLFRSGDNVRRIFIKLIEGQSSSITPVMTYLRSVLEFFYYEMIDRVGPAPGGRILFKPRTIFTPPPACNIFYPQNYSYFQESRDLVNSPTRMMFQTNAFLEPNQAGSLDITTMIRFAPKELQSRFDQMLRSGVRTPEQLVAIYSSVTQEEQRRGIIAEYGALSPAEWLMAKKAGTAAAGDAVLGEVAEYKFRLKQLQFRHATVNHMFDPDIAVGFPGVVVDDQFTVLGLVSQVTHSFGTDGVSSTISLSHVREAHEGLEAQNPPWMSSTYSSGRALGEVTGFAPVTSL